MEGDGVDLLVECLVNVSRHILVVPDAHRLIHGAGGDQRLAHARVEPGDGATMEGVSEQLKVHLLLLKDLDVGERQHKDLRVFEATY